MTDDPDRPFDLGWPVARDDGLDDLQRFLHEPGFRPRFRLPGGQFALCRRDEATGRCVALRDPSATIPLHAHFDGRDWLVSSRVAAIEERVGRRFPIRLSVLRKLHQQARIGVNESLYEETMMLAPGAVYRLGPGARVQRQEIPIEWPVRAPADERLWTSAEAMAGELVDSIRSAVAAAAGEDSAALQLSGGLDSNLLLHAGVRSGVPLRAVGMAFPGLDCDESDAMTASCRMLGIPPEAIDYGGKVYDDWKEELFSGAEYVPFTTAFMALAVARRVRAAGEQVLLNGMGGDEIFDLGPAAASAFLARFFGLRAPLRLWRDHPRRMIRGVLRRGVSGRGRSLTPFFRSGAAPFQMALVQRLASEGVNYRMPLCDWRVIVRARLVNALYTVATADHRRSFQRALLDQFSPGLSGLVGLRKPHFNAVGMAQCETPSELGRARAPRFQRLVPDFIAFQRTTGRLVR